MSERVAAMPCFCSCAGMLSAAIADGIRCCGCRAYCSTATAVAVIRVECRVPSRRALSSSTIVKHLSGVMIRDYLNPPPPSFYNSKASSKISDECEY